jgi:prepilin-type N-terminal cleavage/methylation domain-containing protein/prepilin-type processing-associated H-X9-DG protein
VSKKKSAFTLVELLVVIGIIALLISILLPALSKARESANTIKCGANLRAIGQGITDYTTEFRGKFPPSNFYTGLGYDPVIGQTPTQPTSGYTHWSSFLYTRKDLANTDGAYASTSGWEMFQCPSLPNGGLLPANAYGGAFELPVAGPDQTGVVDRQAPRMAYTVNEALCGRGIYQKGFDGNSRLFYKFVSAARVHHSAEVILATEIWGTQSTVITTGRISGQASSASRRPISGVTSPGGSPAVDYLYRANIPASQFTWATVLDLSPDPQSQLSAGLSVINTTLDWVGRNHGGSKKFGRVAGDTSNRQWDLRKSNFLYVDGHVETKHVVQTVYPTNQWTYNSDFYSLDP